MSLFRGVMDRVLVAVCVAFLVAVGWGCSSARVAQDQEESVRSTLIVARAGDAVKLSWESKPGLLYTVVYSSSLGGNAKWLPLPGCERIAGNGQTMEVEDRAPEGQARYYRLHIVNASTR